MAQLRLERRFAFWELQEASCTFVGMWLPRGKDFSVNATQKKFSGELELMPTPSKICTERQRSLSVYKTRSSQCKAGDLHWPATACHPDFCNRLARLAPKIGGTFRVNELIRTAK